MMRASINNQNAISETTSPFLPWIVCFSAALFFFFEFIQMNMFDAISANLMHDFAIDATQLGNLSATYLWGDVVLLFPAGILLDRFSVRVIIMTGMLLGILGSLIFSLTHSFAIAALAHFVAGLGNAFSFLSCIKLASRWFPPKRMALVIGLIVTFAMAGGIVAQTPLTMLNATVGWREALMLNSCLGTAILIIIFFFVRDFPPNQEHQQHDQQNELSKSGFWGSIKQALSNPQNWLGGLYTSFLNLPIMVFGAVYGVMHLTQDHNLSADKASFVVSMIFFGTILGGPTVGWISDQLGLRKLPMILCAVASLITILAIMFLPNLSFTDLMVLYLTLGIFTSGQILGYPIIAESNPKYLTGTSMGIAAVLIMGGGAVFQPLFGWLLDFHKHAYLVHGVQVYTHNDFARALIMIPVAFIFGLIAVLLMRETYCKAFIDSSPTNRESSYVHSRSRTS